MPKSIYDLNMQMVKIVNAIRKCYTPDDEVFFKMSGTEQRAVMERMNSQIDKVKSIYFRYCNNIYKCKEYKEAIKKAKTEYEHDPYMGSYRDVEHYTSCRARQVKVSHKTLMGL